MFSFVDDSGMAQRISADFDLGFVSPVEVSSASFFVTTPAKSVGTSVVAHVPVT